MSTVAGNSASNTPSKKLCATSAQTKELPMQIRYVKEAGVLLVFPHNEMNVVLQVLKAMYRVTQYRFIGQAISDIEADMRPQVEAVNYHHICEHCFTEVDERDPNAFRMTARAIDGKESSKWIHYKCPELKPNRPV